MKTSWSLTWALAPIFFSDATAIEACSLYQFRCGRDADTSPDNRSNPPSPMPTMMRGAKAGVLAAVATALALLAAASASAQQTSPSLVAVFAHPDDESAAAPVLARYAREGAQVYLIIATDGAQGGAHTAIPRGPGLAAVRSDEARCAAEALGIHQPTLLGFPDAALGSYLDDPARLFRLAQRLHEELQKIRPDALITWSPDGATGHPDHRLVSSVVTQLVRAGAPGVPENLFYVSLPIEGMRAVNPSRPEPAFLVPLPKYFTVRIAFTPADGEAARRAMACHRTQFSADALRQVNEAQARYWNESLLLAPLVSGDARTDLFRPR